MKNEDLELIRAAAHSDDSNVRYFLAEDLLDVPAEYSKDILLGLLHDRDRLVRVNAADSLGSFACSDILAELVRFLSAEKYSLARAYAVLSVGDILSAMNDIALSRYTLSTLHGLFDGEKSRYVKNDYYRTFYLLGEEQYFKRMIKGLNSVNYGTRCASVHNLESVANAANIDEIKSALQKRLETESANAVISTINSATQNLCEKYK